MIANIQSLAQLFPGKIKLMGGKKMYYVLVKLNALCPGTTHVKTVILTLSFS